MIIFSNWYSIFKVAGTFFYKCMILPQLNKLSRLLLKSISFVGFLYTPLGRTVVLRQATVWAVNLQHVF